MVMSFFWKVPIHKKPITLLPHNGLIFSMEIQLPCCKKACNIKDTCYTWSQKTVNSYILSRILIYLQCIKNLKMAFVKALLYADPLWKFNTLFIFMYSRYPWNFFKIFWKRLFNIFYPANLCLCLSRLNMQLRPPTGVTNDIPTP